MKTDELQNVIIGAIGEMLPNTCLASWPVRGPVSGLTWNDNYIRVTVVYDDNAIPGNETYGGRIDIALDVVALDVATEIPGEVRPEYAAACGEFRKIVEAVMLMENLNTRLKRGKCLMLLPDGDYETTVEGSDRYLRGISYKTYMQH